MTIRDDEWVVCPFCQHQMGDCFDWCKSEDPQRTTCDSCGEEFICWAEYDVQYCSKRPDEILAFALAQAREDKADGGYNFQPRFAPDAVARLWHAARLGLDMARANDLTKTAETIMEAMNAVECTCNGSDEMCPCQNRRPAPDPEARLVEAARGENERLQTIIDNLHAVEQKHRETANAEFHRANRLQVEIERLTKERQAFEGMAKDNYARLQKAEAERDKAPELVERLNVVARCGTDSTMRHFAYASMAQDPDGDYVTYSAYAALAEENRRLREAIRQADDILEDCGFAIEIGARRVLRIALSSTGREGVMAVSTAQREA